MLLSGCATSGNYNPNTGEVYEGNNSSLKDFPKAFVDSLADQGSISTEWVRIRTYSSRPVAVLGTEFYIDGSRHQLSSARIVPSGYSRVEVKIASYPGWNCLIWGETGGGQACLSPIFKDGQTVELGGECRQECRE